MEGAAPQGLEAGQLRDVGDLVGGETGKAARYLKELEQARSQCLWKDIPELARKVQKHAPHRQLLVLAERSELEAISFLHERSGVTRPVTPTSRISALVPPLRNGINDRAAHSFDKLRATVILGWVLWILDEPELALERLSTIDLDVIRDQALSSQDMKDSKHDTVIEAYLLKGEMLERLNPRSLCFGEWLTVYSTQRGSTSIGPQLHRWVEQILSRLCGLLSQRIQSLPVDEQSKALEAFRLWAKFCNFKPIAGVVDVAETGIVSGVKRRDVWKAYYDSLSIILRSNAQSPELTNSFAPGTNSVEKGSTVNVRRAQRNEVKRAEVCYESLLLEETTFPKADQRNDEVERWVAAVIANWGVFCGPIWQDEDLGEDGKTGILYRAATKTFHSTQILRHLFTVHSWLGEFDLAFKAYGSYVDIVNKGKARAEKSGQRQADLDDDDTVLSTAAEAVKLLCHYGSRTEVEKSLDVCQDIQEWLAKDTVSSQTNRIAHRAIGIAQATWARLTYENTSRSSIQAEGLEHLREAIEPRVPLEEGLRTAFALSLLLAETRDLQGAISLIKNVIAMSSNTLSSTTRGSSGPEYAGYLIERRLCSLWHLLALLLSSKSDFAAAERLCDAAFEQFGESADLFGQSEASNQAIHEGEVLEKDMAYQNSSPTSQGIVDQMEANEKEGLVQIKITQLTLLEVNEGPVAAIEASHELLGLYGRLFGDPGRIHLASQSQGQEPVPKTSSSTIKSFGGSILGRPKSSRRKLERHSSAIERPNTASVASRPSTTGTQATVPLPLIQVIGEDGEGSDGTPSHRHSHLPFRKGHNTGEQTHNRDSSRPKSFPAWKQGGDSHASQDSGAVASSNPQNKASTQPTPNKGGEVQDVASSAGRPDQPLPRISHNMPPTSAPPPPGHTNQPPRQDTRLPTAPPGVSQPSPEPRFALLQEYRRKASLLVTVWLFIAGLYTRATLTDDADSAIDEAQKLVEALETKISQESSSSRAFAERGWGLGYSVDQLWAEVYAERGALAEARSSPYEALASYEQALAYFPDHAAAIISLSGILLDIYAQKIPAEPSEESPSSHPTHLKPISTSALAANDDKDTSKKSSKSMETEDSPELLNRLAARDRAYGLLSALTKLGTGWDNSEAWFMLARAYEESGQIEKAKEVLWWCVELEDGRPLRHWRCVGTGGFVL
ncbi:MAG: hypothetical protein M1821_008881 [Bathelium mastoideum]|nr:MAG: hypothetical protein M1821_008881 [Bathelium mastoideum]